MDIRNTVSSNVIYVTESDQMKGLTFYGDENVFGTYEFSAYIEHTS